MEACAPPAIRSVLREDRWPFDVGHCGWRSGGEALAWPNDVVWNMVIFYRLLMFFSDSVYLLGYREPNGVTVFVFVLIPSKLVMH